MLLKLPYSRAWEYAADKCGLEYLWRHRWNPKPAASFLRKLEDGSESCYFLEFLRASRHIKAGSKP